MFIYFLLSVVWILVEAEASHCEWDRDDETFKFPPLIMGTDPWRSILPTISTDGTGRRVIRIEQDATVVLACTQTLIEVLGEEVVEAKCIGGEVLLVQGQEYSLIDLECTKRVREDIQRDMGTCADDQGMLYSIGFDVQGYDFYPLIDVCFDPMTEALLYENHTIRGASIAGHDVNPSRPSFRTDRGFYTVSPSTCYGITSQRKLMDMLISNSSIINIATSHYFARGHMAPDAAFCSEMEEDATYYYINALPQWQAFNNGNWKFLESSTRDLAEGYDSDLLVWSGSWGVLELANQETDQSIPIYLGLTEDEEVIPAPLINWKVVYEPSSDRGLAVVGVNNPFLTEFPETLCTDICDTIDWIDFDTHVLSKGATYCCTVQDLKEVVPIAPDLPSAGILTQ